MNSTIELSFPYSERDYVQGCVHITLRAFDSGLTSL